MWKRKTKEDYKREKKELFLGISKSDYFFCSIVSSFFAFCLYIATPNILGVIGAFVIFFILSCIGVRFFGDAGAIFDIFTGGLTIAPSDICNVCHSVVSRSKNKKCECGGKYEPFDDWKWVEDETEESA